MGDLLEICPWVASRVVNGSGFTGSCQSPTSISDLVPHALALLLPLIIFLSPAGENHCSFLPPSLQFLSPPLQFFSPLSAVFFPFLCILLSLSLQVCSPFFAVFHPFSAVSFPFSAAFFLFLSPISSRLSRSSFAHLSGLFLPFLPFSSFSQKLLQVERSVHAFC